MASCRWRRITISSILLLAFSGCRAVPAEGIRVIELRLDARGHASLDPALYPREVVIHVPRGSRLIAFEANSPNAYDNILRERLYQRIFSAGVRVEFWVWLSAEGSFASFDRQSYDYELSIEEERFALLARAYAVED